MRAEPIEVRMVSKTLYESITVKYGSVASWAVWAKARVNPTSNISDISVLDPSLNPEILELVTTDIIMVGLNLSQKGASESAFMNFHSENPYGKDYKIRFAFEGTKFYGAYMTDIIKDLPMPNAYSVVRHLRDNPSVISEQIDRFREELKFIGASKPILLAFGRDTFNILQGNLHRDEYLALVQLTHYSHQINKENYRQDTLKRLEVLNDTTP